MLFSLMRLSIDKGYEMLSCLCIEKIQIFIARDPQNMYAIFFRAVRKVILVVINN